jgi:hypothetical protein
MSALDQLLLRLKTVSQAGVPVAVPQPTATQQSPTPPTNLNFVNASVSYNATTDSYDISTSGVAPGIAGQVLMTTTAGAVAWETFIGDASASGNGKISVIGLLGSPLPSLVAGALQYTGSQWELAGLGTGSIAPGGSTGDILVTSGSSVSWVYMTGDVSLSGSGVATVESISGATPIAIKPSALQWAGTTAAPMISQAAPTTDVAAQTLTISAQSAYASASVNTSGGYLLLSGGSPSGSGALGGVSIGTVDGNVGYVMSTFNFAGGSLYQTFGGTIFNNSNVTIAANSSAAPLSSAGAKLTLASQAGDGTSTFGGDVEIAPGGSGGESPNYGLPSFPTATIATSASTGGITIPATCAGFLTVRINGTKYKIPYFNT